MRIPKKIRFCGFTYKIKEVEKLDGNDNWGRTMLGDLVIYLERGLPQEKKEETFLHELLHITLRNTGLLDKLKNEDEEQLVRSWSYNIYGILKENRLLREE